jgi:uncharacterized protein YaiI (UPF0178 family)
MRVIIDGDSQPEKEKVIALLQKYNIKVILIMSISHYTENINPYAEVMYVDNRAQEADIKIMNIVKDDDIVITADTGLSYFLLGKKVVVLNPRGKIFSEKTAGEKIEIVHLEKKIRRSKKKTRIKGPSSYKNEDLKNLLKTLEYLILKYNRNL